MIDENFQGILNSLKADLIIYKDSIKEVSEDMLKEGFSEYPVFIAHQHDVALGEKILDKEELAMTWSINATTLEELLEKNIILSDKEQAFRETFKNPSAYICIMLVTEVKAGFIFIPYIVAPDPSNN